jgi:sulfate permease, SulP family
MGYTKIADTLVFTGLYTILIPMTLFALFGSSRRYCQVKTNQM